MSLDAFDVLKCSLFKLCLFDFSMLAFGVALTSLAVLAFTFTVLSANGGAGQKKKTAAQKSLKEAPPIIAFPLRGICLFLRYSRFVFALLLFGQKRSAICGILCRCFCVLSRFIGESLTLKSSRFGLFGEPIRFFCIRKRDLLLLCPLAFRAILLRLFVFCLLACNPLRLFALPFFLAGVLPIDRRTRNSHRLFRIRSVSVLWYLNRRPHRSRVPRAMSWNSTRTSLRRSMRWRRSVESRARPCSRFWQKRARRAVYLRTMTRARSARDRLRRRATPAAIRLDVPLTLRRTRGREWMDSA